MRSVAFVNKKGGVGKSSCVMHLGGVLARMGLRTLLVDVDQQASLSQGLLGPRTALELPAASTIAGLYEESVGASMLDLVLDVGRPNLALVAGHDRMTTFNVPSPWTTGDDQFILREGLAEVAGDFDICLLDCPPHIQACAWSAMLAADAVVIPAQLEDYGIQGVSMILDSIEQVRAGANPRLTLLGFLPTMVSKLAVHATYDADLRAAYGDDVFENVVPMAKDFKEALTLRKSIIEYKPKSAAAKSIQAVAKEMLERLEARCGGLVSGAPDGRRRAG